MSFLSKIFGGGRQKQSFFVISDGYLEAAQMVRKGREPVLISANRVKLPEGVVVKGGIIDEAGFAEAVQELFDEAQPRPVKSDHLFVSAPFGQTFSFAKVFSGRSQEELMRSALTESIQEQSPFGADDLHIEFSLTSSSRGNIYSALAYPRPWLKKVFEAFGRMGIDDLDFIAEPAAQIKLSGKENAGNSALLSWQDGKIYLSLFLDDVLYDSFAINANGAPNQKTLIDEFRKADENFTAVFGEPIRNLYLADFPSPLADRLVKELKSDELFSESLDKNSAGISELIPSDDYSSTLIGLSAKLFDV